MSTGATLPRGFNGRAFLTLALPMIVSRAGLASMGIADGIMVARFGPHEFASLSLSETILGRLLDTFIAFLIGGLSLVPRHFSSGDSAAARALWMRTLPVALMLGAAGFLTGLAGAPLLALAGQKAELARAAGPVMAILGVGHPAAMLAISAAVYLEGINRPRFVALSVMTANALNIALNWLFIAGHLGLPALGARGSALATTLVRYGLCGALVSFAWRWGREQQPDALTAEQAAERAASRKAQWRLGFGAASTVGTLLALTASLTLFAGRMGVLPLAAFAASFGLAGPAGLLGLGMADAAGVYVASEAARGGLRAAGATAWASLRITLAPVCAAVFIMTFWAAPCAALYSNDIPMRVAMAAVIPIVAFILLADCSGFVMASSLRSLREVAWPVAIDIGSMHWLVPLAAHLAFGKNLGIRGLFLAMLAAGISRTLLLTGRFLWLTRRAAFEPGSPDEEAELACQAG